jgi:hypothetical protein
MNILGVGTAPTGAAGDIVAIGNITAYYSSDRRLKERIAKILQPLEKLRQINGVMFDWTQEYIDRRGGENGYSVRRHDTGVIAQEIEQILPEIVALREDGYLAVYYEKLIPLLIESIKELSEAHDALAVKIKNLEDRTHR